MPRLTISIDEDQQDWLEAEAERQDRSKAYVLRELIDAHRAGEVSIASVNADEYLTAHSDSSDSNSHADKDLVELVEDLRARLDDVESAVATEKAEPDETTSESGALIPPAPDDSEPADTAAPATHDHLVDAVREYLDAEDLPPKTAHGRDAVADVFAELRERGEADTSDLRDAVYPAYDDEWSDSRTMWNSLSRYLEEVPGIDKGGYGSWTYTGDDAVREALDGE